jgi:hypothetical protein
MSSGLIASSVTSAEFLAVFDEIKALIPIVLPAVIAFAGIRKGFGFIMNAVHKA